MASLFPMFLKLEGQKCVVVGGGRVADGKLDSLLSAGAYVRVIAPEVTERIRELERQGRLRWDPYCFAPKDLNGAFLVVAAAGSRGVNEQVYQAAAERGVLCNSVDDPERCHFFYPAIVQRGDLQIAISTAGKSPALAQRIRRELEQRFDENYADWLRWLGIVRELFFRRPIDAEARKVALHRIAAGGVYERFRLSRLRRPAEVSHG